MARLRRPAWPSSWLALALLVWSWAVVAQPTVLETQVKAAYLFKFAGFVEWPEGSFARPDSPILIGVAGNDALADQLELLVAGRNVAGRTLTVRRVKRGEPLGGVHILYLGARERGSADLIDAVRGQAVLTVSDAGDGAPPCCMISFVMEQDRLRFDVALKQVNASRLRISARMLAAAHRVQGTS